MTRGPTGATATASMRSEALSHADSLFRLAYHLTGTDADAEDLVQDTYARALGATSRFTEGTNVRAWLFRILRNAYIDSYRRERVNPVRGGLEDEVPPDAAPPGPGRDDFGPDRSTIPPRGPACGALTAFRPPGRARAAVPVRRHRVRDGHDRLVARQPTDHF